MTIDVYSYHECAITIVNVASHDHSIDLLIFPRTFDDDIRVVVAIDVINNNPDNAIIIVYETDLVIIIIDAINIVITIDLIHISHDDTIISFVVTTIRTDRVIIAIDAINMITIDLIDNNRDDAMMIMYGTDIVIITIDAINIITIDVINNLAISNNPYILLSWTAMTSYHYSLKYQSNECIHRNNCIHGISDSRYGHVDDDVFIISYDESYRDDNCIDRTDLVITSDDDAIIIVLDDASDHECAIKIV